ncbi:hypothetical protein CRENBAI_017402 [Crenichthys baileyi]|uniref:Uncharacterized protein n=1 Tax=Crenichthys baileyi TaxID=28760 RepID=A0AAV9RR95_9TELE
MLRDYGADRDSTSTALTTGPPRKFQVVPYASSRLEATVLSPRATDLPPWTYDRYGGDPTKRHPLGVSQHTPKLPAPDTENHMYTSGQRHRPPAVPNDPHPHLERGPCTKEGSTWSKLPRQPEPPQNKIVPNPPMKSDPNPMSPPSPMNPDMNFPIGPPPTRTQISNTCPRTQALCIPSLQLMGTPPHVSYIPKKPTEPHPQSACSTHSPAPSTPNTSCPHHTVRRDSKATQAPAHRRNRADTIKHRAHNGTSDPTPRWDKLTQQEASSKHSGSASPTTAPQPHKGTTSLPLQQ